MYNVYKTVDYLSTCTNVFLFCLFSCFTHFLNSVQSVTVVPMCAYECSMHYLTTDKQPF